MTTTPKITVISNSKKLAMPEFKKGDVIREFSVTPKGEIKIFVRRRKPTTKKH